jgi:hypothetical protein
MHAEEERREPLVWFDWRELEVGAEVYEGDGSGDDPASLTALEIYCDGSLFPDWVTDILQERFGDELLEKALDALEGEGS